MSPADFVPDGLCAQCGDGPQPVASFIFHVRVLPSESVRSIKPSELGQPIGLSLCAGCLGEAHGFVVANTITKESQSCRHL
jgi:hypothetical protein